MVKLRDSLKTVYGVLGVQGSSTASINEFIQTKFAEGVGKNSNLSESRSSG
jgi:hypothetical protein